MRLIVLGMATMNFLAATPCFAQAAERHPRLDLIVREVDPSVSITLAGHGPYTSPFAGATKVATLASTGSKAFGTVTQARLDDSGYLYVLDSEFNEIHVFDPLGRSVTQLGSHTSGASFRSPMAIAVGTTRMGSRLFVADKSKRVYVYARNEDSLYLERSFTLPQLPYDLCAQNDELVAQSGGYNEAETIRAYGPDAELITSFASLYKTDNKLLRLTFARSRIACVADSIVVAVPETSIPDVRAYTIRGKALWVTTLSRYQPVPAFTQGPGALRVSLPESGYHRAYSVNELPNGELIVQFGYVVPPATTPGSESHVSTIVLSARTGAGRYIGDSIPPVIATNGRSFVVLRQKPSRSIEIWRFRR